MKKKTEFLAGVDEAGRGPLAGPVAVGVVVVPHDFDWGMIPGVGDSKKVSPTNRESIFRLAQRLKREKVIDYAVVLIPSSTIDRINIAKAVVLGITRCFQKLKLNPKTTRVKLDGLLRAPSEFRDQETIIGGDGKEKTIGLASILAKVTRDRHMVKMGEKYPVYGFSVHKGYGTKVHREKLQKYGLSPIHRRTFTRAYHSIPPNGG